MTPTNCVQSAWDGLVAGYDHLSMGWLSIIFAFTVTILPILLLWLGYRWRIRRSLRK